MTDALNNMAKSSSFQEKQHFFSDIPIFKDNNFQCFDKWLKHMDIVTSLTNDPYKLAFCKISGIV